MTAKTAPRPRGTRTFRRYVGGKRLSRYGVPHDLPLA